MLVCLSAVLIGWISTDVVVASKSSATARQPRIAYTHVLPGGRAADIYVANADGTASHTLARSRWAGACPHWSPDGSKIAFVGHNGLYVVDARGGGLHRETPLADGGSNIVDWSPDGRKLLFQSFRPLGLFVLDRGNARLTKLRSRLVRDADWSPDGRTITFVTDDGVYLTTADGKNERRLTRAVLAYSVEWSPSGRMIAFDGTIGNDSEIFLIGSDGRGRRNLSRSSGDDQDPTWSPDGTKLAYTHFEAGKAQLHVVGANGLGRVDLTDRGTDRDPAWSSDGRLAFSHREKLASDPYALMRIYVVDSDGTDRRVLTRDGRTYLLCPEWSRRP